jgi:hypothetical protein
MLRRGESRVDIAAFLVETAERQDHEWVALGPESVRMLES